MIGMAEFCKYAAAEACPDDARRGVQVSRVITGGAIVSVIGPFSASFAGGLDKENLLHGYAVFFLILGAFSFLAFLASTMLRLPTFTTKESERSQPFHTILKRTNVWVSISLQVFAQFVMVVPMTAVPLSMVNHLGLPAGSPLIAGAIVSHTLSMFLPGLVTGHLANYLGKHFVMNFGVMISAGACVVGLLDFKLLNVFTSMVLLGVGWNWAFVTSTMTLLSSHSVAERSKVSSFNEALRFAANAFGAIASSTWDWNTLCVVCLTLNLVMVILGQFALRREEKS